MTADHADRPAPEHTRPPGVSDATVAALGTLSLALETAIRARGALYEWHQLIGGADRTLADAVRQLREAGHAEHADLVEHELLGRNVIPGHWSFQVIEGHNATYHQPFVEIEARVRDDLVDGRDHLYEAEMRERLRTRGHPDHTALPVCGCHQ